MNCHKNDFDSIEPESSISNTRGTVSKAGEGGGTDCVSCHEMGGSGATKHIDVSAIKQE